MKLFWGLLVLSFGILALAVNQGWVGSDIWMIIISLWPIILIAVGLNLIVTNKRVLSMLMVLLVLASVGFVVLTQTNDSSVPDTSFFSGMKTDNQTYTDNLTSTYDNTKIQSVNVTLSTGAAKIKVSQLPAGTPTNSLYVIKTQNMGKIVASQVEKDGKITLQIEESTGLHMNRKMMFERELELYLPADPKLEITLESGASQVALDLSGLNVSNLDFDTGASTVDITLGERADRQNISFDAGASTITFYVPKTVGVQATLDGGVMNVESDPGLSIEKSGDSYHSVGFDSAKTRVVINGSAGVSKIKFKER